MSTPLQNIYQVTKAQYEQLVAGGAVGTHTFDANALYLVEGEAVDLSDYYTKMELNSIFNDFESRIAALENIANAEEGTY